MGEDRRGALMVNCLVTFISRVISNAGKSSQYVRYSKPIDLGVLILIDPGRMRESL